MEQGLLCWPSEQDQQKTLEVEGLPTIEWRLWSCCWTSTKHIRLRSKNRRTGCGPNIPRTLCSIVGHASHDYRGGIPPSIREHQGQKSASCKKQIHLVWPLCCFCVPKVTRLAVQQRGSCQTVSPKPTVCEHYNLSLCLLKWPLSKSRVPATTMRHTIIWGIFWGVSISRHCSVSLLLPSTMVWLSAQKSHLPE